MSTKPAGTGQPKRPPGRPTVADRADVRRRNAEWLALIDQGAETFSSLARKTGMSRAAIQEAVKRERKLQAEEASAPIREGPPSDDADPRRLTPGEKAHVRAYYGSKPRFKDDSAVVAFRDLVGGLETSAPTKRVKVRTNRHPEVFDFRRINPDQLNPLEELIREEEAEAESRWLFD